ncbi:MAG: hypothetical protein GXO70_08120 [Acidobacteria bacterium]|nr:hypothetical protein [Acidobacteriota bacterium]
MNYDENAHDIAHKGDETVNGKTEFGPGQDEISDEFILEADLSGGTRLVSSENVEKEEREKDEMTVDVIQTVTRLEELDRLLGELNFHELIMQFGKVQGDLELIRYELDILRNESTRVREALSQTDYLENHGQVEPIEIIGDFRERIYALADGVRKLISQQEILSNYATSSRGWLLDRSGEALQSLKRFREAQRSRMEMVASLNEMLESDAPNEKLASAALEFAVLMRELDGDEGLEKLDTVISEMSGFRDEVEQAETMVLGDTPQLEDMKDNLGLIEEVPNMAGELFSFLATVLRTLDKIAIGWNGEKSTESTDQEEISSAEPDE